MSGGGYSPYSEHNGLNDLGGSVISIHVFVNLSYSRDLLPFYIIESISHGTYM